MDVIKEIILMLDNIEVISWYMQKLQQLFSTENQIKLLLSTYPIMFGLMKILIISPQNTSTHQFLYSLDNIMKIIFIIQISSSLIPCKTDITYTPFCDATIITYEIDLSPSGKKVGFNLLDDEVFTIPYIIDTIPNSPASHQLP